MVRENASAFTSADLPRFLNEMFEIEVRNLSTRLRAASRRITELAPRVPDQPRGDGEWNAKEILAHVAVLSRAYGVFSYMIASGKLTELRLGEVISQRDVEGDKYMAMPAVEIAADAVRHHERTLKFLERATVPQMLRACRVEDGTITAEYVVRLPLVVHLEQHVAELEKALA